MALSLCLECVYPPKTVLVSTPEDIPDFLYKENKDDYFQTKTGVIVVTSLICCKKLAAAP